MIDSNTRTIRQFGERLDVRERQPRKPDLGLVLHELESAELGEETIADTNAPVVELL